MTAEYVRPLALVAGPRPVTSIAEQRATRRCARSLAYSVTFIDTAHALRDEDLRSVWSSFAASSTNPDSLYQSPHWTEALLSDAGEDRSQLVVLRNADGGIAGIVPVRFQNASLDFSIGARSLAGRTWPVANILGSQPLLVDDPAAHGALYRALLRRTDRCGGLLFRSLPTDSLAWRMLNGDAAAGKWLLHAIDGHQRHHHIHLSTTLDAYLSRIHRKHRRQLRQLMMRFDHRHVAGSSLVRVDAPHQVDAFLRACARVSEQSWQHQQIGPRIRVDPQEVQRMKRLALSGILRSYVLYVDNEPCAFVVGYQYGGVFHYFEVGYAQKYAHLSPGTALLLMILRDLVQYRPLRWLNFGVGDAPYKARFSTGTTTDASLLVLPRTLPNRLVTRAHSGFLGVRARLRTVFGRR